MDESFGKHLREARESQGLTAEMIAIPCGVSRSYITLIENDMRLPGKKILPKLASALNVKTAVVLNWYLEHIRRNLEKVE